MPVMALGAPPRIGGPRAPKPVPSGLGRQLLGGARREEGVEAEMRLGQGSRAFLLQLGRQGCGRAASGLCCPGTALTPSRSVRLALVWTKPEGASSDASGQEGVCVGKTEPPTPSSGSWLIFCVVFSPGAGKVGGQTQLSGSQEGCSPGGKMRHQTKLKEPSCFPLGQALSECVRLKPRFHGSSTRGPHSSNGPA